MIFCGLPKIDPAECCWYLMIPMSWVFWHTLWLCQNSYGNWCHFCRWFTVLKLVMWKIAMSNYQMVYIYIYPRITGTALPSLSSSFVPLCDGSVGYARFCKDRYWIVLVTSHVFSNCRCPMMSKRKTSSSKAWMICGVDIKDINRIRQYPKKSPDLPINFLMNFPGHNPIDH